MSWACRQEIIEKEPSAGLWQGQTDVAELGMTYADLDRYLTTQEATPSVKERIEKLHAASEHKRRMRLLSPRSGKLF